MSEVQLVTNGLNPEKCARIKAEMQSKGYGKIVVSKGQYENLTAAGLNADLMQVVIGVPAPDDMEYLGGIITRKESPKK